MEIKNEEVISTLELKDVFKVNYRLKCWNYWKLSAVLSVISMWFPCLTMCMWNSSLTEIVTWVFWLAYFYMTIVIMVNRFHDLWKSSWNILFLLIPIYNIYLTILLSFSKWQKYDNKYGNYLDKQIVFNPSADKIFNILAILSIVIPIALIALFLLWWVYLLSHFK